MGVAIVAAGIVGILVATLGHSWHRLDLGGILGEQAALGGLDVRMGLRGVTACSVGQGCVSMEFSQIARGSASIYAMVGTVTFLVGLLVSAAAAFGTFVMLTSQGEGPLRWAFKAALALLPLTLGVLITFPGNVPSHVSWAPLAMVLGVVAVGVGIYVLRTADLSSVRGGPLVTVAANPGGVPSAPYGAAPPQPAPTSAGLPSGAQRAVDPGKRVRFAASQLRLDDTGVHAETPDGPVTLPWGDLAFVRAVLLPPEAPWSRQLMVDLAALMGPPLRALPSTKLGLPQLAATSIENLRALCREAIARAPSAEIDDATRRFAAGQAPASLLGAEQVHAYERRFGG